MQGRVFDGSYHALEERLFDLIDSIRKEGQILQLTVLAPSSLVVKNLKKQSAERFPNGLLGVHYATFFQYALDLARKDGKAYIESPLFFEQLVLQWIKQANAQNLRGLAPTYESASALLGAIYDLKESAIDTDPSVLIERLRDVVEQYERGIEETKLTAFDILKFGLVQSAFQYYESELEKLRILDMPGVYLAAKKHVRANECIIVFGFYDMTQSQADLIGEMCKRCHVNLFVPYGKDQDTWRYGDWFRNTFVNMITKSAEHLDDNNVLLNPVIHNAAGEHDEIWFCAKEIRKLIDQGCPPSEIALVSRTQEPYLKHIEPLFTEHKIPFELKGGSPILEFPLAKVIRLFTRSKTDLYARSSIIEIILHPLFSGPKDRKHWNLLTRALHIVRGDDWEKLGRYAATGYLVRAGDENGEGSGELKISSGTVTSLINVVKSITDLAWPVTASWSEHVAVFKEAILKCFDFSGALDEENRVLDEVQRILESISELDRFGKIVTHEEFIEAFERELQRRTIPRNSQGGVMAVDAMAARGLTFRHVFLVGVNARTFPRFIVEEPFLSDALRREVLRVTGHHISVRTDGYDEERLLFHLIRAGAKKQFICIYQRADSSGRLKDPSPYLRDFLPLDLRLVSAVPAKPRLKIMKVQIRTPHEWCLVQNDVANALRSFRFDANLYKRAVDYLNEIESRLASGKFEGITGPLKDIKTEFSATRLENYGTCPFKYFVDKVLQLTPFEEQFEEEDLATFEIGTFMHKILCFLYQKLAGKNFDSKYLSSILEEAVAEASVEFQNETGIKFVGPFAARRDQIVRQIKAYAEWDINNLGEWLPTWFEEGVSVEIGDLRIKGRLDRIDKRQKSSDVRVIDYKRKYNDHYNPSFSTQALKGKKLQAPVYMKLAQIIAEKHGSEDASVKEAAFHFIANYDLEDPSDDKIRTKHLVKEMSQASYAESYDEVMNVIKTFVDMIKGGYFFISPDDRSNGHCNWCNFRSICRKNHGWLRKKCLPDKLEGSIPYWNIVNRKGK